MNYRKSVHVNLLMVERRHRLSFGRRGTLLRPFEYEYEYEYDEIKYLPMSTGYSYSIKEAVVQT